MSGLIESLPFVVAQAAGAGAGGGNGAGGAGGMLGPLVMFLPMIVVLYLLLVLPQQRQEKQRRAMIAALKKNDRVVTSGGIYGTVASIDPQDDRMVIRSGDTRLDVTRSSVVRVIQESSEKSPGASG